MSKQCPVCKTINYDAANYCSICNNKFLDKELSEEDIVRIELHEAKATIQGLNKVLAEMQKNRDISEEALKNIAEYKVKLNKERQENSKYASLIFEKDRIFTIISKQLKTTKSSRTFWIVVLLFFCITLGIKIMDLNQDIDNLNEKIDTISDYYPIIIKSLKVVNMNNDGTIETDNSNKLYSSTSMYLQPQIEYIVLKNTTITLFQKLYQNGTLIQSNSSLDGYTTQCDIYTLDKRVSGLIGVGYETKGKWPAGNYRYEIWYNDICLKTLNFKLY